MPPKKKVEGPSKKTEQKKKEKIVEDKTFGLKNKKGGKQQKFIKHVTNQVQYGNQSAKKLEALQNEKLKKKDDKKKELDELNQLFRPAVVQQKVSKGADPKSVVCAFYKQGQCGKGDRCKFSHDLSKERKGEKRSMYDAQEEKADMDAWDEAKLEEVIEKKHGEKNKGLPPTSIICKYFLEAVENNKYGWFWECPNGATCHYKHALPPGFVLKKDKKKEEKEEQITIEELVEKERAALGDNVTKVTLETFLAWKERKKKEKVEKLMSAKNKRKADFKAGKALGVSGRELFEFNPDMIVDDDEATDDVYERVEEENEEGEEEEGPVKEIDMEELSRVEYDTTRKGTESSSSNRMGAPSASLDDEATKLAQAAALPETNNTEKQTDHAIAAALAATINGEVLAGDVPIDENLFDEEDLDLLEEDLETLDLDQ